MVQMSHSVLESIGAAQVARKEQRLSVAHRDLVEAVRLCRQSAAMRNLVQALKTVWESSASSL